MRLARQPSTHLPSSDPNRRVDPLAFTLQAVVGEFIVPSRSTVEFEFVAPHGARPRGSAGENDNGAAREGERDDKA